MANRITFKLVGSDKNRGQVNFADFIKFCEGVEKCLRRSEAIVTGSDYARISYRIADLKCASATIVLEAQKVDATDTRKSVLKFFRETVSDIEVGKIDSRMGVDDLQAFREIANPIKHNDLKVVIGRTRISESFANNIDKLLKGGMSADGNLTGKLERVNLHDRNEFVLYPIAGPSSVTCNFSNELWEKIRPAIRSNVTILGTLFYREGGDHPYRAHVRHIEVHPSDDDLPTLNDVAVLGKWGTGGLSSVEFVRSLRDD